MTIAKRGTPLDLPALERLPGETVNQWVYRDLRHAVMIGRVPPGRALTIREIAAALDVSTMPVREALRRLATEQALEVLENRRVQVPQMTAEKFHELCELRIALEVHAAERALPFLTEARLGELAVIDADLEVARQNGDREATTTLNQVFHRFLYETNPHQIAMPQIESVWLQLGPFTRLALSRLDDHYHVDRHNEALGALGRRDGAALRAAVEADIRDGMGHVGTAELLDAYVRSAGRTS